MTDEPTVYERRSAARRELMEIERLIKRKRRLESKLALISKRLDTARSAHMPTPHCTHLQFRRKVRYPTAEAARAAAIPEGLDLKVYHCPHCDGWHRAKRGSKP